MRMHVYMQAYPQICGPSRRWSSHARLPTTCSCHQHVCESWRAVGNHLSRACLLVVFFCRWHMPRPFPKRCPSAAVPVRSSCVHGQGSRYTSYNAVFHGPTIGCMGACSVAASYKPPMLVTRAQLPACACKSSRRLTRSYVVHPGVALPMPDFPPHAATNMYVKAGGSWATSSAEPVRSSFCLAGSTCPDLCPRDAPVLLSLCGAAVRSERRSMHRM